MIGPATSFKILAVFLIMLSSLSGAGLPFIYIWLYTSKGDVKKTVGLDTEPLFFILKSLSCGVIIGVALLHLLPDADETLADDFGYPVAFATAGLGVMICLSCEQFAMWLVSTSPSERHAHLEAPTPTGEYTLTDSLLHEVNAERTSRNDDSDPAAVPTKVAVDADHQLSTKRVHHEDIKDHPHSYDDDSAHGNYRNQQAERRSSSRRSVEVRRHRSRSRGRLSVDRVETDDIHDHASRTDSACEVGLVVQLLASSDDARTLLKAYILEAAIAVHSVIMGVSLGAMGREDLGPIKVLIIAYIIHQLLEGISLGCAISSTALSSAKVLGLVAFFICTLPVGIVIGMVVVEGADDYVAGLVEGVANGIAAGILIYVSMVEILADEFAHDAVRTNYLLKVKMILAMSTGLGLMALLAEWA